MDGVVFARSVRLARRVTAQMFRFFPPGDCRFARRRRRCTDLLHPVRFALFRRSPPSRSQRAAVDAARLGPGWSGRYCLLLRHGAVQRSHRFGVRRVGNHDALSWTACGFGRSQSLDRQPGAMLRCDRRYPHDPLDAGADPGRSQTHHRNRQARRPFLVRQRRDAIGGAGSNIRAMLAAAFEYGSWQ